MHHAISWFEIPVKILAEQKNSTVPFMILKCPK